MKRRQVVSGAALLASGLAAGAKGGDVGGSATELDQAVNKVLDRIASDFAGDAAHFLDTVAQSMSGMVDAFDTLVSRRLMNDQPRAAQEFLSMRLKATRLMGETSKAKLDQLKALEAEAKAKAGLMK